jgi:hypothetical protein
MLTGIFAGMVNIESSSSHNGPEKIRSLLFANGANLLIPVFDPTHDIGKSPLEGGLSASKLNGEFTQRWRRIPIVSCWC